MIITYIKRAALITAMTGTVALSGSWALSDITDEWTRQAQIDTLRSEQLAELEIMAMATAQAQGAALKELEIEEKQLELIVMKNDATRANERANVSHEIEIEREYQLAWIWSTSKGLLYGMVGIVPVTMGGLILWRVITVKRQEDEDRKLVDIMAAGAIPVSREFMLNEPAKMFEFAAIRAQMDAEAKLIKAGQPNLPNLTTWTQAPTTTYSPSTSTSKTVTNDKELLMMAQNRQLESEEDNNKGAEGEKSTIIFELLEGQGVPVYVRLLATGPQVETFSIRPGRKIVKNRMKRITVREITKHEADIAMALGVANVRIEQKGGFIACEVARAEREFVSMEEMIRSAEWLASMNDMTLPMALGQNTLGENVIMDLCTMPHFLAGGATSMGKSVLIRSVIASLALQPVEKVRLVLIDPKEVEFEPFRPIPHVTKIITDMDLAANSLESALIEMDRRSKLFKSKGVQKLSEYNAKSRDKLPYIVIIIDELADLMATNKDEVEDLIVRIAQKARFAGIHLILATQRPDADTITPLIRANVPARCSVRTMTSGDSRTILDATGAEKLLDQGDSLIKSAQLPLTRMQAAYISMEGAIKQIKLALSTNKTAFKALVDSETDSGTTAEQLRNKCGINAEQLTVFDSGNKSETENGTTAKQVGGTNKNDQMDDEERRNKIRILITQGKSETAIVKAIWGRVGGRKDKARREEVREVMAALELNGNQSGTFE